MARTLYTQVVALLLKFIAWSHENFIAYSHENVLKCLLDHFLNKSQSDMLDVFLQC